MIANRQHFYVDSRNRISGTDSNFTFAIPLKKDETFTHVCILDAVIPKSYYLIRAGKNTFTLVENGTLITVTIPTGNYSRRSFQATLQTLLTAASLNGWTYTITYPTATSAADTGKYIYTVTNNSGSQPSFIFTTNVFEQLGFNLNSTHTFSNNTITSANVIKMQQEDALFIHSDIASNGKDSIL